MNRRRVVHTSQNRKVGKVGKVNAMQRTPNLEEQIRMELHSLADVNKFCNLWRAVAGENVEPPPLDGTQEGKLAREAM